MLQPDAAAQCCLLLKNPLSHPRCSSAVDTEDSRVSFSVSEQAGQMKLDDPAAAGSLAHQGADRRRHFVESQPFRSEEVDGVQNERVGQLR